MTWTLICGTWKTTDAALLREVRQSVRDTLTAGSNIVTAGSLGADLAAAEETLRRVPDGSRLRIVIPAPFRAYCEKVRMIAEQGETTELQAEELISVLEALRKVAPDNIYELAHSTIDEQAFQDLRREVVQMADSVLAFSLSDSSGTADIIAKAKARGIPVTERQYSAPL